jgi:hypothetical protein
MLMGLRMAEPHCPNEPRPMNQKLKRRNLVQVPLQVRPKSLGARGFSPAPFTLTGNLTRKDVAEPSSGWPRPNGVGYRFCFGGRAIGSGWPGPPNFREWGGPTHRSVVVGIQLRRPYAFSVDRHCSARWANRSYSSAARKSLRFKFGSHLI